MANMEKTPKELKQYSIILLQTCVIDLCLTSVNAFVQPVFLSVDSYLIFYQNGLAGAISSPINLLIFPIYLFNYYVAMSSNAVQFFYRYLAICRNTHVSAIKYFCMLGVAGLFSLILAVSSCLSCYLNSANSYDWTEKIKQTYDIDGIHISCMETSASLFYVLNSAYIILFTIICYIFIFVCGFKIRSLIKKHQNFKKTENDMQMTTTLILQAILPLIAGCVGFTGAIASMFSITESNKVDLLLFVTGPSHWIPVLNPLITIIVVKPYRQIFTRRKVTNSSPLFNRTSNNSNRLSIINFNSKNDD